MNSYLPEGHGMHAVEAALLANEFIPHGVGELAPLVLTK